MAYSAPTAADLKARFPAFAAVSDDAVTGALEEAARRVDETWPEDDYRLGRLLYAAHVLASDGLGTSKETLLQGFSTVKVGPISLGVANSDKVPAGKLASTSYGRRFAELVRANFGGPFTT